MPSCKTCSLLSMNKKITITVKKILMWVKFSAVFIELSVKIENKLDGCSPFRTHSAIY